MRRGRDLPRCIVRRGSKWRVGVMVQRKRYTKTFKTLDEAISYRDSLRPRRMKSAAKNPPVTPSRRSPEEWTLKDAFDHALNKPASDGGWKGCRWERDVRRYAEQIKEYFGKHSRLTTIRKAKAGDRPGAKTIDGFIEVCRGGLHAGPLPTKHGGKTKHRARPNNNSTINRKLDVLKKALRLAVAFKALDTMPAFPPRPREGRKKLRFFSLKEEADLLAALITFSQSPETHDAEGWREAHEQMIVLIDAGVRWGELFAILPQHFDEVRRELYVPGIEDSGQQNDDLDRVVPLSGRAFAILERRCRDGSRPFTLGYNGLSYRFDKVKAHMGLKHDRRFTIHTARHTFCSRLAQEGVDVTVIKDLAGHRSIATTLRYIHLNTKTKRAAIEAVERAHAGAPGHETPTSC